LQPQTPCGLKHFHSSSINNIDPESCEDAKKRGDHQNDRLGLPKSILIAPLDYTHGEKEPSVDDIVASITHAIDKSSLVVVFGAESLTGPSAKPTDCGSRGGSTPRRSNSGPKGGSRGGANRTSNQGSFTGFSGCSPSSIFCQLATLYFIATNICRVGIPIRVNRWRPVTPAGTT
jgi:hypothetical protein